MKNKMFIVRIFVVFLTSCVVNPATIEQQTTSCTIHKETETELIESCNHKYKRTEITISN
ncbi:hypothetical protein [Borreliella yangtzensis]|uniref:Lipoprotein n=1 Tax=Borreliella yangtzensis TaxID=683292 RepID=A0ABR6PCL0_9SPIR|nr:hypothetical protein [Borreliella yangtzensis]